MCSKNIDKFIIRIFVKDEIPVIALDDLDAYLDDDILICVKSEVIENRISIVWEDIYMLFYKYTYTLYMQNYDYFYLKNTYGTAKERTISGLIAGSSYACFGVDMTQLKEVKNLALPSQDIYYACKLLTQICKDNPNIRKVILGMGCYSLYSDLSRTKNMEEIRRVENTYWPLLKDKHNCREEIGQAIDYMESEIWDTERIVEYMSQQIYQNYNQQYWTADRRREAWATCLWNDKNIGWNELSEESRIEYGRKRAESHLKALTYSESFKENIETLNIFSIFCIEHEIELNIVIFPASKYYLPIIEEKYKEEFVKVLDQLEGVIQYWDGSRMEEFVDDDFNDMDHLNTKGAEKFTAFLKTKIF